MHYDVTKLDVIRQLYKWYMGSAIVKEKQTFRFAMDIAIVIRNPKKKGTSPEEENRLNKKSRKETFHKQEN